MRRIPMGVRFPKGALLAWVGVIMAMSFVIVVLPQIDIDPTLKSMIMADDPDLPADKEAKKRLGDDEMVVIAIENPKTVFDIPTLTYIDRLTVALEKLPGVRKVYSLTRSENIRAEGGMMNADDLIIELPKTQEELARIEKEAFENPLYVNMIVAPDKKVASINMELTPGHGTKDDAELTLKVYDIIEQAASSKPPGVNT